MEDGLYRGFEYKLEPHGVGVIRFNQPERLNGMTQVAKRDLAEALLQLEMDSRVRVIVITGSGRAFSAGDDITGKPVSYDGATALVPDLPRGGPPIERISSLRLRSQSIAWLVRNISKLTIASINGVAVQAGLSLALACDYRLASNEARLGSGTLRFAYQPDEGGHYLLVKIMGATRALDFMMRNKIVGADEARSLGLVSEVLPPEELWPRTMELATELANGPQVAMRLLKRSIYRCEELTMEQAGEDIAVRTAISDYHEDAHDGRQSFVEKRRPRFNAWIEAQGDGR
ncbi:MAG: enoyl-CoA hydratase/isomerase family protein [Hyphomicrobiales bacterium]